MYNISREFVVRWSVTDAGTAPGTVDTICPSCGVPMAFVLTDWSSAAEVNTRYATSRCVNCGEVASFFWVGESLDVTAGEDERFSLFMHPTPNMTRRPIDGIEDSKRFEMSLRRAYASAVNMYNAREWTGTVVVVRRTLEDIAKMMVPPDVQKLHLSKQIEALRKSKDFSEPVAMLSDILRRSSNLGPYFELEKEPDREVATLVLDLLNHLVQYVFATPAGIEKLHHAVDKLPEREKAAAA